MNVRLSHPRLCEVLPRNHPPRDKGIGKPYSKCKITSVQKGVTQLFVLMVNGRDKKTAANALTKQNAESCYYPGGIYVARLRHRDQEVANVFYHVSRNFFTL